MSEKVKCPECRGTGKVPTNLSMTFWKDCPTCHGTGSAPTGEGLLTKEDIIRIATEENDPDFYKELSPAEWDLLHFVADAQAALTAGQKDREWQKEVNRLVKEVESYADELVKAKRVAGQMIEEIEREIAGHSNFRPDSLWWRSFKSRYGGKQSG